MANILDFECIQDNRQNVNRCYLLIALATKLAMWLRMVSRTIFLQSHKEKDIQRQKKLGGF